MGLHWFGTVVIFMGIIAAHSSAPAQLFGPQSYDDCILESLPKAQTERAANLMARACRDKFPAKVEKNAPPLPLTDSLTFYWNGREFLQGQGSEFFGGLVPQVVNVDQASRAGRKIKVLFSPVLSEKMMGQILDENIWFFYKY